MLVAAKPAAFAINEIRTALAGIEQKRKSSPGPEMEPQIKALTDLQTPTAGDGIKAGG